MLEDGGEVLLQGLRREVDEYEVSSSPYSITGAKLVSPHTALQGLSWYLKALPLKFICNVVLIESKDLRTLRHGFRANAAVVKAVYLHAKASPFEPDRKPPG